MARLARVCTVVVWLICSNAAYASLIDISPTAQFIVDRPYMQLSSDSPIGAITAGQIEKASGLVPSIADGLVAWADGRSGMAAIMGFDLTNIPGGEFLISDETDAWQEGNPFVGINGSSQRRVLYDAAEISVGGGDEGDIQGSPGTPPPAGTQWVYQGLRLQRCPVFNVVNVEYQTAAWIDHPGTQSQFAGYVNNDIYVQDNPPLLTGIAGPAPTPTNITSNRPAPREHLAGDGRYLVWQELRMVDPMTQQSSWDIAVYDLGGSYADPDDRFTYLDGPVAGNGQIAPDICGDLVVYTQEEVLGEAPPTNIYLHDLASAIGPIPITTTGAATNAAVTCFTVEEDRQAVETCFVVWQDHHEDPTTSVYPGGNTETDFHWDIWGQELRRSLDSGEWELYKDAFLIRSDVGRQMNPDIDGVDVVWQSQATGTEDIFVWGPIPEPSTLALLAVGGWATLAARRRRRGTGCNG